jgi:hypothetical protein
MSSWTLIEHSPLLSSELRRIEGIPVRDDDLVGALLDFYLLVDLLYARVVTFTPIEHVPEWTNELSDSSAGTM